MMPACGVARRGAESSQNVARRGSPRKMRTRARDAHRKVTCATRMRGRGRFLCDLREGSLWRVRAGDLIPGVAAPPPDQCAERALQTETTGSCLGEEAKWWARYACPQGDVRGVLFPAQPPVCAGVGGAVCDVSSLRGAPRSAAAVALRVSPRAPRARVLGVPDGTGTGRAARVGTRSPHAPGPPASTARGRGAPSCGWRLRRRGILRRPRQAPQQRR